MSFSKLAHITERVTATVAHGLLTYVGTDQGNIYSIVNSTGVVALVKSISESIISLSIVHPTLYVTVNAGTVYTLDLSTTADAYAGVSIGANANVAGSGAALGGSITAAQRCYADDGGVAMTAGAYRASVSRMLIATALAAGDISAYGNQSQLKVVADASLATGILGGEWGYVELASGGKVNVAGALVGHVDLPTGAYVVSGGYLAGVLVKSNDLSGTKTGHVVGFYMPNPGAGIFDALAALGSASMTFDTSTITGDMTPTGYKGIPVYINGVLGYIPWATAWA